MNLQKADKVEITVVMDNYADWILEENETRNYSTYALYRYLCNF